MTATSPPARTPQEDNTMNERDELRGTLANTICNASNYPRRASPYLLGEDMSPVLDKTADAILAAGYRKTEAKWAETLVNDGTHEFTVSSDCDGSNVTYWRRTPGKVYIEDAGAWEAYEPVGGES